jgi:hypothetical protein
MTIKPLEGRALHIIYCNEDKRPIGPHGWKSAVADAEGIARLERGPLIGVATGAISGIVVVDVDPRNGGDKTFAEHLSWLPPTRTHRTRSGGQHRIYKYPEQGIRNFNGTEKNGFPGIEVKSDGYGVVCPPSPGYSVLDDRAVADCPDRLRELVETLRPSPKRKEHDALVVYVNQNNNRFVPKPLHDKIIELMPGAPPLHQRRVRGILRVLIQTRELRNFALLDAAIQFDTLIEQGIIPRADAEELLFMAAEMNGYVAKDGEGEVWSTIRSGLNYQTKTTRASCSAGDFSPEEYFSQLMGEKP